MAMFDGGTAVMVTEIWDDDGTVDREAAVKPIGGAFSTSVPPSAESTR
jgi:hypothetical protein